MRTPWMAALALLAGLAGPLPADEDLSEAKPYDAVSEGKPAAKDQAVAAAEGKPRKLHPLDAVDFVFVASDRPVLLRLHLRNGGRPYPAAWDDYMQKLYAHMDRNGDGVLDKAETERAPDAQFLQFQLQGNIGNRYRGLKGQMGQLDTNKDGKVNLDEFKAFYQRRGLAPLQLFSNSNQGATDLVTSTIYQRLDSNKDNKLTAEEMTRTEAALQRFDLDENEILTAAELRPGGEETNGFILPRGGGMGGPNGEMGFLEIKPDAVEGVARQVLTHYDKDKNGTLSQTESGFDKPLFDQLDTNRDGQLDAKEFPRFFQRDADLELIARVGKLQKDDGVVVDFLRNVGVSALRGIRAEVFNPTKRPMSLAAQVRRVDPAALAFSLGDAHIGLSAADQQFASFPRRFYEREFNQADTNKKGVLDRKQAMTAQFLGQFFDLVDRDGNGKLTRKELNAYLDMQTEGSSSRLQLTITDEGRSLFELLDEDSDSRLSLRELRTSWSRMKPLARSDSGLSRQDIPRRLDVAVGPAQRRFRVQPAPRGGTSMAGRSRSAPLWFQKMDRNQDGDISPREFIASDEDFRKLDTDGDGLISGEEARQFEERLKKEKENKR